MIPSLVRAAAPLARPVAKKMVPALSAAALATPTLMNADESERAREGGRGKGSTLWHWQQAGPQAVAGDSSGAVTDATEGQTDAANAAPPPPSEGGREGNGNRCKHCFVGFRGRSFFSRNPSLTRSVDRPAVAGAKNAARMMRQCI